MVPNTRSKIENMTVAMTDAAMVNRPVKNVMTVNGNKRRKMNGPRRWGGRSLYSCVSGRLRSGGREDAANGATKIRTKQRTVAVMKSPNIQWEAVLAIFSASVMSLGS